MPSSSSGFAGADLRTRLLWLTIFRTVATVLLLAVLGVQLSASPRGELGVSEYTSFGFIALSFFVTLINGLLLRGDAVPRAAAWVQIAVDVLLAASIVFLTDGSRSPFIFLFLVAIIGGAMLLGMRGAIAGLLGASSTYLLVLVTQRGGLPGALDVAVQLLAQALIAVLSGYVGEQLSRTGGRLSASEKSLRSLTELQNEIVNAMPSGLVTCDEAGIVTFVNPAAQAILGLDASAAGSRRLDELIPLVQARPTSRRTELTVGTARGERILGLSVAPLADGKGQLVVFQDLTELRHVEKELDRIDHLAALGRLSAQLAHEIRNPLAAMRGSAQMLLGGGDTSDKLARLIVRESDRLAALVEGYLTLARPPPPRLAPQRLDVVVRETLELFRADATFAGATVEEQLAPLEALADPAQLKQVVLNLLRNAAAAVRASRGRIRVSVALRDGAPAVEVWDSAGAITESDRPRLFEPFFSRAEGGSGLGLSTVHAIVQAHGGAVDVTSTPATGTTFSVKLRAPGADDVANSHR